MAENKNNRREQEPEFSNRVKAGKRTYFFDVRSTLNDSKYITITESKKRKKRGSEDFFYERHKIFLYGEDFENFLDALSETVEYVKQNSDEEIVSRQDYQESSTDFNKKETTDKNKDLASLENPQDLISSKDEFLNDADSTDFNVDADDDTELKWD